MPLALLGALTIGLSLGLLGSGGSILTVPVLHYLAGQPDRLAIGGSLLVVGIIAGIGCLPYALFAGVMLLAAERMLRDAAIAPSSREPHRLAVVAGGTGVGLLSGLVGVGGGFLIVPALVLLAGVPMASAVGTSLAVITLNSFSGFGKYLAVLAHEGCAASQPPLSPRRRTRA